MFYVKTLHTICRYSNDVPIYVRLPTNLLLINRITAINGNPINNPIPAPEPPSLKEAVRMIAKLGGFLCRKSDGEPGVKTIWRGLRRLHDIAQTWKLISSRI